MPANAFPFRRTILALAISLACASGATSAAEINVGNGCTLINAINNANADADTDGPKGCPAGSGADTINLGQRKTYELTKVNNDTDGPNGLPSVTSVITINGNNTTVLRSETEGTPNFRLFDVAKTGQLTLQSLTLKNGRLQDYESYYCMNGEFGYRCWWDSRGYFGAGLANSGKTSLVNTVITGNTNIGGFGGGIFNSGTLILTNSTTSKNTSLNKRVNPNNYSNDGGYGGGIWNSGKAVLTASTVSGNSAFRGGGIFNAGAGTINLKTTTVSSNSAQSNVQVTPFGYADGGGIFNNGTATLTTCTLSGNSIGAGDWGDIGGSGISNAGTMKLVANTLSGNSLNGIFNHGKMTLKNSIVANTKYGSDCVATIDDTPQQEGVNLIEDGSCNAKLSGDPKLGPLKDNGGPTLTHALLSGSPAIDAARSCFASSLSTDQRGVARKQPTNGYCDIGAYEHIPVTTDSVSPSVWPVVDFFNAQVTGGGIIGAGYTPNHNRLAALNQLAAAGDMRDHARDAQACEQLTRLLVRIDPDASPDGNDYITGSAAGALAEHITRLKTNWKCP